MIDELSRVVKAPLDRALPWLGSSPSTYNDVLHFENAKTTESTLHSLAGNIIKTPGPFARFDYLIVDVVSVLEQHVALGVDFVYNAIDTSHQSLLCWLPSGVLGLRGEERETNEEFDLAKRALSDKLSTKDAVFFSGVPYQLCYARGGNRIQFFALDLQHGGARVPLCDSFTLCSSRSRSLCVRIVVNIFRVMRTLNDCFPERCWTMDNVLLELKDSVTICSNHVEKRTTAFTGSVLLELSQSLLMNPIKCLVRPIEAPLIEDDCLVLLAQPIGCYRAPSANQVKLAAHSVLDGYIEMCNL